MREVLHEKLFYGPEQYSTKIADAWQVVEKMRGRYDSAFGFYLCKICNVDHRQIDYCEATFAADLVVDSLMEKLNPEAICKAGLLAVMEATT